MLLDSWNKTPPYHMQSFGFLQSYSSSFYMDFFWELMYYTWQKKIPQSDGIIEIAALPLIM